MQVYSNTNDGNMQAIYSARRDSNENLTTQEVIQFMDIIPYHRTVWSIHYDACCTRLD
jgi:hypothetical protein